MEFVDQFIQSFFTDEAEAFPTPLLQAVQDGDEENIAQLLMDGTSLMAKGKDGMTVFHKVVRNIAYNEKKNDNVLKALIISPRSGVLKTVTEILSVKEDKVLEKLVHWHISGLLRVLAVEDSNGRNNLP